KRPLGARAANRRRAAFDQPAAQIVENGVMGNAPLSRRLAPGGAVGLERGDKLQGRSNGQHAQKRGEAGSFLGRKGHDADFRSRTARSSLVVLCDQSAVKRAFSRFTLRRNPFWTFRRLSTS